MNFIQNLKTRLTQTLPGIKAQGEMSPSIQRVKAIAPKDARVACVLVLFYPKNEALNIVFIERASNNTVSYTHLTLPTICSV